jgi:Spy/CpxP family protein refolding chaperone
MKSLLAVTLAAALALPAMAQTPPKMLTPAEMAKHKVKTLTTLLSLTSVQQQQATTIFTYAAKTEQTTLESDRTLHENLRSAIKTNDGATIDQVSVALAQSTAQLTSTRAKADAAFYQILTADQQTKLSELESQHMGPLDGPGGPGGPPPAMGFR